MASIEIKVPVLPESVADASIATWYKKSGDSVKRDEHLVDIETDKVVLEVVAPADGKLGDILKNEGDRVSAQEVIGKLEEQAPSNEGNSSQTLSPASEQAHIEASSTPVQTDKTESNTANKAVAVSPSVRRLAESQSVDLNHVIGSGKSGRILKEDVLKALEEKPLPKPSPVLTEKNTHNTPAIAVTPSKVSDTAEGGSHRVPMSRLRARIAERLIEAQQTAAILTTFNEVNMQPVMQLRQKYKDLFEKKQGVKLGFMSFFTLAVVEALKRFPIMNASVEGQDIVYHDDQHIGIAVSAPRGLVVPVLRQAQTLSMAEIEKQIATFGEKAKNNTLSLEELSGGTFTISNGGVFGSLMSTPILNPPQSAILGMHKIEERPVVENGQVQIRPMMYLALSYDHRIIDGADSVRFLVTIKEQLEDPARLLLGV